MDLRSQRGQATRQSIVEVATRLFTESGYDQVSIDEVLKACEISRGALYHHFHGKEALFVAALEAAEERVKATAAHAAQGAKNPLDALRAGCKAWIQLAADDAVVRRIVLIDAPAVLGWQKWREVDSRYGLGLLKAGLEMMAAAGRMPAPQVDLNAHVLLAVLTEVASHLVRATGAANLSASTEAVEQILSRFAGVEPNAAWESWKRPDSLIAPHGDGRSA